MMPKSFRHHLYKGTLQKWGIHVREAKRVCLEGKNKCWEVQRFVRVCLVNKWFSLVHSLVSLVKQVRTLEALTKDQPPPERPVLKGPPQTPRTAGGIVRYLYGDVQQAGGDAVRFFADDVVYEDMNYETPFVAHLARDKGHSNAQMWCWLCSLKQSTNIFRNDSGLVGCVLCVQAGRLMTSEKLWTLFFKHWLGIVESIHFWVD